MNVEVRLEALPLEILRSIFEHSRAEDLASLSRTCKYFKELISSECLWRHLCLRDFNISDHGLVSYENLYKKLLHKYGWMLGTYVICIGPSRLLAELRYRNGKVECVYWRSGKFPAFIEEVTFRISLSPDPVIECFPNHKVRREDDSETFHDQHPCKIHFNKITGVLKQECQRIVYHNFGVPSCNRKYRLHCNFWASCVNSLSFPCMMCTNDILCFKPLLIPTKKDLPIELRPSNGKIPPRLLTPGLFHGFTHSDTPNILCLRYKNEHEIVGLNVDGLGNGGLLLKIFLSSPVSPSIEEQESLEKLKECQIIARDAEQPASQPYRLPSNCCKTDLYPSGVDSCKARYLGCMKGRMVDTFCPAHIIIFNDDTVGVMTLEEKLFKVFTIQREQLELTSNIITEVESAV